MTAVPAGPARTPASVARAILAGAVIIAAGIFGTNTLHDVHERGQQAALRNEAAECRHWEEAARVAAFSEAELRRLNGTARGEEKSPEYWVALHKVERWYPRSALEPDGARVDRPVFC